MHWWGVIPQVSTLEYYLRLLPQTTTPGYWSEVLVGLVSQVTPPPFFETDMIELNNFCLSFFFIKKFKKNMNICPEGGRMLWWGVVLRSSTTW